LLWGNLIQKIKLNDEDDQSPGRIERNLDQVTAAFPECPLCKSAANFIISGLFKNFAVCEACRAGWTSHEFYDDGPLLTLSLTKTGKFKEIKPLLDKFRSVEFWKHFDFGTTDYDLIGNLLSLYNCPDPFNSRPGWRDCNTESVKQTSLSGKLILKSCPLTSGRFGYFDFIHSCRARSADPQVHDPGE
jgi:hypothetical protein